MNVASPGKTHFMKEELAVLQAIAYQIGTAAHRIRLFQMEQKRANLYAKLGLATREIGALLDGKGLASGIVRSTGKHMGWPGVALYVREPHALTRRALYRNARLDERILVITEQPETFMDRALAENRTVLWQRRSGRHIRDCLNWTRR
jgi:GAF domain-containing protein